MIPFLRNFYIYLYTNKVPMRMDHLSSISLLLLIYSEQITTLKLRMYVITQLLISRQLLSFGVRNSVCSCSGLLPRPSLYPVQFDRCHILGVLLAQPRCHTCACWTRGHYCAHHDNLDGFDQCSFAKNLLCQVP